MREVADADRIRRFMRALGGEAEADARVYFTGGATAVLFGWRSSTIDVDIKIVPESDRLFRAIPRIKEGLIEPSLALRYFEAIEPHLYRYPALDPASFRRAVQEIFGPPWI